MSTKNLNAIKKSREKIYFTRKSIIISIIVSMLIPIILLLIRNIILFVISNFENYIKPYTYIDLTNSILDLQIFAYIELLLITTSAIWLVFRFIPIIILGYLNGILLEKKFMQIRRKYLYLILTSILVYLISLAIGGLIFIGLYHIPILQPIFNFFDYFGI